MNDKALSKSLSVFDSPLTEAGKLLGETKFKALKLLLDGGMTTDQVSKSLGVNRNAAKGHLDDLEQMKFIEARFERAALGRPKKIYSIAELGRELFTRRYDTFLTLLLEKLKSSSPDTLNRVTLEIAYELGDEIRISGGEEASLQERLSLLVNVLNAMGFKTRFEIEEDFAKIIRTDCAIFRVAKSNPDLICEKFDSRLLSSAIGQEASLVQTIACGSKTCVHEIRLKSE